MQETNLLIRLQALLNASLPLWDVKDVMTVEVSEGQIALCRVDGQYVRISQTPIALRDIARWSITRPDGSSLVCSSVLGVLAAVRDVLATTHRSGLPLRLGVMGVSS